jgi:alkylation response protein AidB-like acyl-CoA dehydrogenase
MGLLGLCVPEELGGLDCLFTTYASIIHELAIWSPSTAVTISVHNMVSHVVRKLAAEPLRSNWLRSCTQAEGLSAFAISEAGAGSDVTSCRMEALESSDGYRINGEKMWITNGMAARWFLMLVRVKGARPDQEYCALLVDGRDPGLDRAKIRGKLGIRGSETAVIHCKDVFVPRDHLIGEPGKGIHVCLSSLNEGRISIASQACGIAEACLREMTSYARTREQFGQAIGRFQAVASMIADSSLEIEAAKLLIWRAANEVDRGELGRASSSMAKLYASEAANRIAYRAVQVHGGTGYIRECRVEQLFRDARITTIYEGTSEVQRMVIARNLGVS